TRALWFIFGPDNGKKSVAPFNLCCIIGSPECFSGESRGSLQILHWTVTYGTASPMGVPQQTCVVTNDNIIINVINKLDDPFLLTWNGIKQRKNSWQDGVLGTNCPIPPNSNFTNKFQTKDQIGTYTYFPSTLMHKAAGAFGGLNVYARSVIAVPYPTPAEDFTLLIGDWFKTSHKALQQFLDSGKALPFPDGVLINSQTQPTFTGDLGKTYMFRISNIGLSTSFNFRIQGHTIKLVEVEGSHVVQNTYESLDVHVGQSLSVLVTLDQAAKDYYIVASTRFTKTVLTATAVLHYSNSHTPVSGPVELDSKRSQAQPSRIIPLWKNHYNKDIRLPSEGPAFLSTSVVPVSLHDFIEVVFQNNEKSLQSWHLDGYDFWVVGYGFGQWTNASRKAYNLDNALTRHTVQVYPNSWTAILVSLDNQGMWNVRSAIWNRHYLGQQFYLRVYDPIRSLANEYDIPRNALLCGKAVGQHP
ncbi:hypothetical protein C3L33_18341, partial [Rhododendron williamsianum]